MASIPPHDHDSPRRGRLGGDDAEQAVVNRLGLSRFTLQRLRLPREPGAATISLDLEGRRVTLRLQRSTFRTPGFRVLVQEPDGGLRAVPPPAAETYRGTVKEVPGSIVGGTIRHGLLRAAIALGDGRLFYVEPVGAATPSADPLHVIYSADAAVTAGEGTCSVNEPQAIVVPRPDGPGAGALAAPRVADLALDADYELFQRNGSSVDSTVHDLETVMSAVNVVYERDCGITHRLSALIVRSTAADPYTSTDAGTLLDELGNHCNAAQTHDGKEPRRRYDRDRLGRRGLQSQQCLRALGDEVLVEPQPAHGAHRARARPQLERRPL